MRIQPAIFNNSIQRNNYNYKANNSIYNANNYKTDSVSFSSKHVDIPVYLVDAYNTDICDRYDDYNLVTKETGLDRPALVKNAKGNSITVGRHYFVILASDVEFTDADGKPALDEEKLKAAIERRSDAFIKAQRAKTPIYLVDAKASELKYTRYDDYNSAVPKTGISRESLVACAKEKPGHRIAGGCFIILASKVEVKNSDGEIDIAETEAKLEEVRLQKIAEQQQNQARKGNRKKKLDVLS